MVRTKIYIEGQSIDIDEAVYSVSLSIADINEIDKRTSGKSIIIEVPATKLNRRIFEHLDSNVSGKVNTRYSGKIVSGGLHMDGDVYIFDSTNENGRVTYRFQITFDNANWINAVGDAALSDLDLSDFDHVYNNTNIVGSWTVAETSKYSYPVIDYGAAGGANVPITYMRPAWRVRDLAKAIFNQNGYKVESDFIDSDFFGNLWMLNNRDFLVPNDEEDYLFRAYKNTSQDINLGESGTVFDGYKWFKIELGDVTTKLGNDSEFYDESASTFTPNTQLTMGMLWNLAFEVVTTNSHQIKLIYGNPTGTQGIDYTAPVPYATGLATGEQTLVGNTYASQLLDYAASPALWIGISTSETGSFKVLNQITTPVDNDSYSQAWNIIYDFNRLYGDGATIDAAGCMKSIKQIDFIKSLKQLFNLYFYTNENERTVYVEPFNTFYTGASQDWSDKLDELQPITLSYVENKKRTRFKYKEDSNDVNQQDKSYTSLGGLQKTQTNINAIEDDEIENDIFAFTLMQQDSSNISVGAVPLPVILTGDNSGIIHHDTEPRILYYGGTPSTCDNWQLNSVVYSQYAYFYSYDNTTQHDNCLTFYDYSNNKGLYERYYDGIFKIYDGIYDGKRIPQLLECSLVLSQGDIANIVSATRNKDLRTCVFLNYGRIRGHYYIQEIEDYNPDEVSCKCKLIRVLDRDAGFNLAVPELLGDFSPLDFNDDFDF